MYTCVTRKDGEKKELTCEVTGQWVILGDGSQDHLDGQNA